jgi:ABC-type glycerol-3-phosphate transport system substrate-binding protein
MSKVHSRRDFLRFAAFGAAGAVLAACQPKTVIVEKEVEKVVKETVVVEKEVKLVEPEEKTVRILMPSWATGEVPFDKAAREFSAEHPGVNVTVQTTFEGWETKVLAQINDGTLEWSGAGIASSASSSLPRWILSGLVQPMDEFIAVSAQEGAQELLTDMLPVLVKASTYEGKFYGMPYSFENISFNWRTDYFEAVGVTEAPETWDDWMDVALKLKEWGADQEIYATSFIPDLDASIGALIYSALDDPFTEEMLLKWESPEALEALEFYKALVQGGMTPPHGYDGYYDAYMGGKIASLQAQSSRGVWGQMAFGTDKVVTSPVPTYQKGKGAGTAFWGNCVSVLANCPHPQEAFDYFVYTMGPQNEQFQRNVIQSGKTPVYESSYALITADPRLGTYQWMLDMRKQVENSVPRPFNNYFSIQDTYYRKYIVTFVEEGSMMTAKECAQLILQDARDEIAKQVL